MKFVQLTNKVLQELQKKGYNVLRSNTAISEDDPTWIPETIDLEKFLDLDSSGLANMSIPMQERWFLIIEEGLKLKDEELLGAVMMEP